RGGPAGVGPRLDSRATQRKAPQPTAPARAALAGAAGWDRSAFVPCLPCVPWFPTSSAWDLHSLPHHDTIPLPLPFVKESPMKPVWTALLVGIAGTGMFLLLPGDQPPDGKGKPPERADGQTKAEPRSPLAWKLDEA